MAAGVQGQWHEQLVALCTREGSSLGKPGSWNTEGLRGIWEGKRILSKRHSLGEEKPRICHVS